MTDADLESVRAHVEILRYARAREAELKEVRVHAEDAIKEALGNQESGKLDGEVVVTWASHKKRQFQQKKFAEFHPELAAEFTELVAARTFKLVN